MWYRWQMAVLKKHQYIKHYDYNNLPARDKSLRGISSGLVPLRLVSKKLVVLKKKDTIVFLKKQAHLPGDWYVAVAK